MKVTIQSKYLVFPVNTKAEMKELVFWSSKQQVYKLNMQLDHLTPNFNAYIDVSAYKGEVLDITVSTETELVFRETDTMDIPGLYAEPERPQIHFSTKNGWLNDPNGLVWWNGRYHMFYQHNPASNSWENMHWGHAVSTDLIHWEEKDIALFPDSRGMMFSGSAIVDHRNLLGKNTEKSQAAVLFYTTTEPFCQNISYSTDNFETIEHYAGNPIVPHIKGDNRDPKVIFCEEMNCYIMVIFTEGEEYCILRSDNLTEWSEVQRILLPGDNECPDIFPLEDENGNRRWVLMGAGDRYLIGVFREGKFVPEQSALSLHYGNTAYAGQTFSNLPDGRRIRVVWEHWPNQEDHFKCQMGIPVELSLDRFNDRFYVQAKPIQELETIYKDTLRYKKVLLSGENKFSKGLKDSPYMIKIGGKMPESGKMEVEMFGQKMRIDFEANQISMNTWQVPFSITKKEIDLIVIIDRCGVEVYTDNGKMYMSWHAKETVCDRTQSLFILSASQEMYLEKVELYELDSIWKSK